MHKQFDDGEIDIIHEHQQLINGDCDSSQKIIQNNIHHGDQQIGNLQQFESILIHPHSIFTPQQ